MTTRRRAELVLADSRARWLVERRKSLGSSDAAAVLGISPFATPLSVYQSKIADAEIVEPPVETEAQRWGNRLEGPIADEFAERNQPLVVEKPLLHSLYRAPDDILHASPDRMLYPPGAPAAQGILEIKATRYKIDDWDAGVPLYVQVQVQHQLLVMALGMAYVAVLIQGQEYRQFEVAADLPFQEALEAKLREFWWAVENRQAPAPSDHRDYDTVKAMFKRATGKVVLLPKHLVPVRNSWLHAREERLVLEKQEKTAATILMQAMGSATVGALPDGTGIKWANEPRKEPAREARTLDVRVLRPLTAKGLLASGYSDSGTAALPAGGHGSEVQPGAEQVPGGREGNDLPAGGEQRGVDRLPDGGESVQP